MSADLTPKYLLIRGDSNTPLPGMLPDAQAHAADTLERVLSEAAAKAQEARRSPLLTTEGRRHRFEEIASETFAEIERVRETVLDPIQKKEAEAGAILSDAMRHRLPSEADAVEWAQLEAEVRTRLSGMDGEEVKRRYLHAAQIGDTQTVRAVERVPASFPLVDDETLSEGRQLHAAARYPAEYAGLTALSTAASTIGWNLGSAVQHVQQLTGILKDSEIHLLAS